MYSVALLYFFFFLTSDILLGLESSLETNSPSRSRSRSPIKRNESGIKEESAEDEDDDDVEEQQSCECYACTLPPVSLNFT